MDYFNLGHYKASPNLLEGKTILITGAGSGIGKTAALTFAEYGAHAVLLGRNQANLETVYDEVAILSNGRSTILPMDLQSSDEDQYRALAETLEENLKSLDGLLLNAGILGHLSPLENISVRDWNSVMQINVYSSFLLIKACLPLLKKSSNASVIFTSSSVGRKARAYWGAYAISKFANEGMMQLLADELVNTSNIRVNSLNPKATNTAMRRAAYPGEDPSKNPSPEEIMGAYLYLMGDESIGITGKAFDAR